MGWGRSHACTRQIRSLTQLLPTSGQDVDNTMDDSPYLGTEEIAKVEEGMEQEHVEQKSTQVAA